MEDTKKDKLEEGFKALVKTPCEFEVGQLVRWKKGLRNRKAPRESDVAVVVEVLDKPVFDERPDAGSAYFRESLTIVLGLIDEDTGDFVTYHFDKRRFEPVE